MITRQPFLRFCFTSLAVLAAINLLLGAWSNRLPYARKLDTIRTARDPNLLLVGNSLLDHHLDEAAFTQTALTLRGSFRPLNAALGASEPPEQRLLFNYAIGNHPGISSLVIGFYDFQLTAEDHSRLADLTGNRMVGLDRRFAPSTVAQAYGFGPLDQFDIAVLQYLPIAANRASAWKLVELMRRHMGSMGMPHAAVNSMGRVDDFAALEAGSPASFDAGASQFLADPTHFNASYEAIFTQAHQRGISINIVAMPMSPFHRQTYYSRPLWSRYLAALTALAARRGIRVIDASDWFPGQQDFVDHLHLAPGAVPGFSTHLAQELAPISRP